MFDGRGIANLILDRCDKLGIEVTNLKLQKLVYFCHVGFLVETKKPLIKHSFEAWEYGPVLPYLYRDVCKYDVRPITGRLTQLNKSTGEYVTAVCNMEGSDKGVLEKLVDTFSKYGASELVQLSHIEGGPWWEVWNHEGDINPGMRIDNSMILDFYSSMH